VPNDNGLAVRLQFFYNTLGVKNLHGKGGLGSLLIAGRHEGGEAKQAEKPAERCVEQNPHTLSRFVRGSFSQTEFDCVARFVKVSAH
jgi:hypothetical protein